MLNFKKYIEFLSIVEFVTGVSSLNETAFPIAWVEQTIEMPKFQEWIKSLGITEPLTKFKEGGVGVAFFAGDYVIKFTTSRKEATAAAVVKGYDSPHLAKVIDVRMISGFADSNNKLKPFYAIVQEKLDTDLVSKRHRVAGQAIYTYLDKNPGFIKSEIDLIMPLVLNYLPKQYKDDQPTKTLVKQMLEKIKKIQDDTGFLTQDTHGGNIAFKGREPAFFDLGRSSMDYEHPRTAGVNIKSLL